VKEFQEKKKFRKLLYSKGVLLFLIIILFFAVRSSLGVYEKSKESGLNLEISTKQLADLSARQQALAVKIKDLKTEEGVEKDIREQFRVAKPGEKMIVIVDSDSSSSTVSDIKAQSLWSKFLGIFGVER
jgi:cell division protein FtsB